jgi:hypothetical protein
MADFEPLSQHLLEVAAALVAVSLGADDDVRRQGWKA